MILDTLRRYWSKVERSGPDDCWNWTGARTQGGYGQIANGEHRRGRSQRTLATHIALAIDNRARPGADYFALHSCDNPRCVNPAHLRWGTAAENHADMWQRERSAAQQRAIASLDEAAAAVAATGRPGNRKISDDDVQRIRGSTARTCDLAREYAVSWTLIDNIRRRKARREVPEIIPT